MGFGGPGREFSLEHRFFRTFELLVPGFQADALPGKWRCDNPCFETYLSNAIAARVEHAENGYLEYARGTGERGEGGGQQGKL